jgi:hypothetical protein
MKASWVRAVQCLTPLWLVLSIFEAAWFWIPSYVTWVICSTLMQVWASKQVARAYERA